MKINIGIVGYGNLGKAIEQVILAKNDFNLVAIFSRRLIQSKFNTPVENYENITNYKNKIDVLLLCGGSFGDLEKQTSELVKDFDCINSFDTHNKILNELEKLDEIAKISNHRVIMSCGWDPGIFSNIRALCYSLSGEKPAVFWGKGISMGHSEAIRNIKDVLDGIEFTIPNTLVMKQARKGKLAGNEQLHFRQCYVVAEKKHQKQIEKQIKNIPNYFKGQPTSVEFVSQKTLLKLRNKMSHKGDIISKFKTIHGSNSLIEFKLKINSNPNFTAEVMAGYIYAITNLRQKNQVGAYTPLDIPTIDLFDSKHRKQIIEKLC